MVEPGAPRPVTDPIAHFSDKARALSAVDLCSGAWTEPSALTPELEPEFCAAPGYPPVHGKAALRTAVAHHYAGQRLTPRHVMITPGATGAVVLALMAATKPGQTVLFPSPTYPISAHAAQQTGRKVKAVEAWTASTSQGRWRIDIDRIEQAIGPETGALVITDPNNPTGSILTADDWDRLVAVCGRRRVQLIADRTYEVYAFSRPVIDAGDLVAAGVQVVSSLSKTFHCASLRVGWLLADPKAITEMGGAAIALFGGVPEMAQAAATTALMAATPADMAAERKSGERRLRALRDRIAPITDRLWSTDGGLFVNVPAAALGVPDARAAWGRLTEFGLGGVPSNAFCFGVAERAPFVRLSFARPLSILTCTRQVAQPALQGGYYG